MRIIRIPVFKHRQLMKQVSSSRRLNTLVTSLVFGPVIVGHSVTHAQSAADTPATTPFDAITIQGESAAMDAPWGSETTRQELDSLQIQSWSDFARRAEPGINFNEANKSINVRGLDQNRVLTRIDGIRQTWLNDVARGVRGGLSTFDFNSLSAIDIVRGADSSVAGSGALGGVVDVRTLNPSDLLGDGKLFGALLKGGYNSVDQSGLTSAAIAGQSSSSTQWLLQAGVRKGSEIVNMGTVGGYGITRTESNPDDYIQQNYLLKAQKKFEGGHSIGLTGSYFERQDKSTDMAAAADLFAWTYRRSCAKYAAVMQSMGLRDPVRVRFRPQLTEAVGRIVRDRVALSEVLTELGLDSAHEPQFEPLLRRELEQLQEHNGARYRLTVPAVRAWIADGRPA